MINTSSVQITHKPNFQRGVSDFDLISQFLKLNFGLQHYPKY